MTKTGLLVLLGVGGIAAYLLWKKMGSASAATRGPSPSSTPVYRVTPTQIEAFYSYYNTPRENTAYKEGDYRRYQSPVNSNMNIARFAQKYGIS